MPAKAMPPVRAREEQPLPPRLLLEERYAPASPEDIEAIAGRWQKESEDPVWTGEVSQLVTDAIGWAEMKATLVEASCRQSICRTHLVFPNTDEAWELASLTEMPEYDVATENFQDEKGLHVVTYIGRKGATLRDPARR